MSTSWLPMLENWVTPERVVTDWRRRLARTEADAVAHFSARSYVTGIAVVGSVGRGDPWPLSDVDMLIVADPCDGEDPENLIRREEQDFNRRACIAQNPTELEAGNWVLTTEDVVAANADDDDAFLKRLEHPHWRGVIIKVEGARVVKDLNCCTARFIERCDQILFDERFVSLSIRMAVREAAQLLERAKKHLDQGDSSAASWLIIKAATRMTTGLYAMWRRLPQSLARAASRLISAAHAAGDESSARLFLTATYLEDGDVRRRAAALPPIGLHECDVFLSIRQLGAEAIDETVAVRDCLFLQMRVRPDDVPAQPPPWLCASDQPRVRRQLDAAAQLLQRLTAAVNPPPPGAL